jgi:hypothetical protein
MALGAVVSTKNAWPVGLGMALATEVSDGNAWPLRLHAWPLGLESGMARATEVSNEKAWPLRLHARLRCTDVSER